MSRGTFDDIYHTDHHEDFGSQMIEIITEGLSEYNKENSLGLSEKEISIVAHNGFQYTSAFNEYFGLNPESKDYDIKVKSITNQMQKIIHDKVE